MNDEKIKKSLTAIILGLFILIIIATLLSLSRRSEGGVTLTISNCTTISGYFENTTCKDLNISKGCNDYIEIIDNSTMARVLVTECG